MENLSTVDVLHSCKDAGYKKTTLVLSEFLDIGKTTTKVSSWK